ncbi:hypothetical protein L873DRAFT_1800434 [Choiromyces venosus 120613-1]|uniref:Uncharacterized protein n=1 Tax=Choiromyces venosus 120613-1 TaxID=1336337 RepID=A0A3N4K018_9PEZI|nr:hypothetical protein L873DRAFT_1800434 [Choiromyces venosus 120613-1]
MDNGSIPPAQWFSGHGPAEQSTVSLTEAEQVDDNSFKQAPITLDNWNVLTQAQFNRKESQAHNPQYCGIGDEPSANNEASLHLGEDSGVVSHPPILPLNPMGETPTDFKLQIDPRLLGLENSSVYPSPIIALRASSALPGRASLSSSHWYNEGVAAAALARGSQNQQKTSVSEDTSKNVPSKNQSAAVTSVTQSGKQIQNTTAPPTPIEKQKAWKFINTTVADYESPKVHQREYSGLEVTQAEYPEREIVPLNILSPSSPPKAARQHLHQTLPSTSTPSTPPRVARNTALLCRIAGGHQARPPQYHDPPPNSADHAKSFSEGQMLQSNTSSTSEALAPNYHPRFRIPQQPVPAPDSRQFQASGSQSSNERPSGTTSYHNYGASTPLANTTFGDNVIRAHASSFNSALTQNSVKTPLSYESSSYTGPGRQEDLIDLGKPTAIGVIHTSPVSSINYATVDPSFLQRQVILKQHEFLSHHNPGELPAPPQQPVGSWENHVDSSTLNDPLSTYRLATSDGGLQQPEHSLELPFGETDSISEWVASPTSSQNPSSGSADMHQRTIKTAEPVVGQPGTDYRSAWQLVGRGNQMASGNFASTSVPVIEITGTQSSGNRRTGDKVQQIGTQIVTPGVPSTAAPSDNRLQIPADLQSYNRRLPQVSRSTLKQAIGNNAQAQRLPVAGQTQPYVVPSYAHLAGVIPAGVIPPNTAVEDTPGATQHNPIVVAAPLVPVQPDFYTTPTAQQQNAPQDFSRNEFGPRNDEPSSSPNIPRENHLLYPQHVSAQYALPLEPIRRNRYISEEALAMTPRLNAGTLASRQYVPGGIIIDNPIPVSGGSGISSGQSVPASVTNNSLPVSGQHEINPTQPAPRVMSKPSPGVSVVASVIGNKRRLEHDSEDSVPPPAAKRVHLSPRETESGSSQPHSPRVVVDLTFEIDSRNTEPAPSGLIEDVNNSPSDYLSTNPNQQPPQYQTASMTGTQVLSTPPVPVPAPSPPLTMHKFDPIQLTHSLGILYKLVADQDDILKKFAAHQEKYGPCLYGFYMGDTHIPIVSELKMRVTDQDDATMQHQGQYLNDVTERISKIVLDVISNMNFTQSLGQFSAIIYFCQARSLGKKIPAFERIVNTRLMASMIFDQQAGWKALEQRGDTKVEMVVVE